MIIQDSIISVMFSRVENIKKVYFQNEDILKKEFNEATVLPIPDDAPVEIPRIILKSKEEHSQLNISPFTASMQTVYTDEYKSNWSSCVSYLDTKIDNLFEFTDVLTNKNYHYVGLVTNILWDQVAENGTEVLVDNLLNIKSEKKPHDVNIKYTYVEKEEYFVNITIQNARVYKDGTHADISGSFSKENLEANTIGITIDINDRYQFNNIQNYKSSKEKFKNIISITTDIIENRLSTLIKEGVY